MGNGHEQQRDLWQNTAQQSAFHALCNAFFIREIERMSKESCANVSLLQRRFASLPFYIEKAASHILSGNCPLTLDMQNGGWIGKQTRKAPKVNFELNQIFYKKYGFTGLIIPVLVFDAEYSTVRIDSIDEMGKSGFHCNQFGWVDYSGKALEQQTLTVLKPSKSAFSAASCGHVWLHTRISSPRMLTLREMLLAAQINWQDFKKPFISSK